MIEKVRVHEIAKELGIASKDVLKKASDIGIEVKSAQSTVSMEEADKLMNFIMNGESNKKAPKAEKKVVLKVKSDTPKKETSEKEVLTEKVQEVQSEVKKDTPKETLKEETSINKEEIQKEEVSEEKVTTSQEAPKKAKPTTGLRVVKPVIRQQIKRSGLKIVKKRKPKVEVKENYNFPEKNTNVSSYGKISAEVLAEIARKKRTQKVSISARKQNQGKKIDIFGGSMSEVSMDMDDQVVLLDLNSTERAPLPPEEPRRQRQARPAGRNSHKGGGNRPRKVSREKRKVYAKHKQEDEIVTQVEIPEDIRVYEFAEKLKRPMSDVIKVLFDLGMMMTKNDFLGHDEIEILSEEFGVEVTIIDPKDEFNYEDNLDQDIDENEVERPPVITIMGHVDHGKTSLLDAIRKAKVTEGEAGGITQHIGAYTIEQKGKAITFIDTPGHAAFSQMRQRGTDITDIIIIVVAADDGVKPQTLEVIKLAKDSGAPVIVALNKMDKETANPDLVKGQMAEQGISPIDWGGDVEFVPVSAKSGMGIDDLLENILRRSS